MGGAKIKAGEKIILWGAQIILAGGKIILASPKWGCGSQKFRGKNVTNQRPDEQPSEGKTLPTRGPELPKVVPREKRYQHGVPNDLLDV